MSLRRFGRRWLPKVGVTEKGFGFEKNFIALGTVAVNDVIGVVVAPSTLLRQTVDGMARATDTSCGSGRGSNR